MIYAVSQQFSASCVSVLSGDAAGSRVTVCQCKYPQPQVRFYYGMH